MTDTHDPAAAPDPHASADRLTATGPVLDDHGSMSYLVMICLVATLGGLLFGYDTAVIANAILYLKPYFHLSSTMEGWLAACALAGCAVGAALAGMLSDYLGRKKVLILCAVLFVISAIGTALPDARWVFVLFRTLGGVGIGAASMTSPMYIAEVSPARIRGRMVSLNQLAIMIGMVGVYFVNYAIASLGDEAWNVSYGWRWMFASGAIPAVALLVLLFGVPESPRWLVKQGRADEGLRVLSRVNGSHAATTELRLITDALRHEDETVWQLFEPGMRVALVIGVVLAVLQQVTGINVMLYYAPKILKEIAETEARTAMLNTILMGIVNLAFTVVAIWTVDKLGRKPLMIFGYIGMALSLLILCLVVQSGNLATWVLLPILTYVASFALSVGPVTWVILSEIFPTKIRGRAMAIATVCLWIANLLVSQTFPMMMDEESWLVQRFHHAFPFYLYGAFCVLAILFMLVFVPETKGRTLEEIERGWTDDAGGR